ncbi:LOW QUALITY PROTEIN: hypothetical protein V1478_017492 [Vespula squamosa]|uniref:Uncharacterized protein n=1 Tax=Vespula squamosa TaxID=30214 RepID=A0ABD1ZX12_VESSQ
MSSNPSPIVRLRRFGWKHYLLPLTFNINSAQPVKLSTVLRLTVFLLLSLISSQIRRDVSRFAKFSNLSGIASHINEKEYLKIFSEEMYLTWKHFE